VLGCHDVSKAWLTPFWCLLPGPPPVVALCRSMFEQGMGSLNLTAAAASLRDYAPRASVNPAGIDMTDCPFAWPYCAQP